jgi:hypothetical protein
MHARKSAALAIIAGLATATSLAGATGTAFAAAPSRTAPNSATIKASVKAPQPKLAQTTTAVASDVNSRNATKVSATAATYRNCYLYSNGTGDLCSWWNTNYGQSRGGNYYADANWLDNYFVTAGYGQWSSMNNNSASAYNYDSYLTARVYTGANGTGYWKVLSPKYGQNHQYPFYLTISSNYWS